MTQLPPISVSGGDAEHDDNALTLGATVTGSLDEPGEADYFTLPDSRPADFYDALDRH